MMSEFQVKEGTRLWEPSQAVIEQANLTHYMHWLAKENGLMFADYDALWQWSVTELGAFWQSIWDYVGIVASATAVTPLAKWSMPGAEWFPEAKLNYAENIFAKMDDTQPAMLYKDEANPLVEIHWQELAEKTAALRQALQSMGVQRGDRVVAYLPNIPEAIMSVLAVSSLGAIWSSCSPDFGPRSVLDRFSQIEPKVLIAIDGYQYNGREFDRTDVVAELQRSLSTLQHTILIRSLSQKTETAVLQNTLLWETLIQQNKGASLAFEQVPFDHPLWILYSSGTTGLPKPIVHGHGGNLLEHAKAIILHNDLKPTDRFFWFTSTGWMMWNYQLGAMLSGCTIVLFNGSPAYPSLNVLWQLAAEAGITYFGTSPAFVSTCMKRRIQPNKMYDLRQIRGVGSTGAPLPANAFDWIYQNVNQDLALESLSGGTDLCTAFVGGARIKPIYAGEIQGASLGAKVEAFDSTGNSVVDEVGELVITVPMPSMPLFFWNDVDNQRYKRSYFEMYPNIWQHGDWIRFNERGGCVIYGRSDATINRKGIRMGTSEIYQCVESLDEIVDSLIVDLELLGRDSYMPLFVVLREGLTLNETLQKVIRNKLRSEISPRHVPNDIFQVAQIPYTLSGKKMEIPIRRILLGQDIAKVANQGAMRNPESISYFIALAQKLNS